MTSSECALKLLESRLRTSALSGKHGWYRKQIGYYPTLIMLWPVSLQSCPQVGGIGSATKLTKKHSQDMINKIPHLKLVMAGCLYYRKQVSVPK